MSDIQSLLDIEAIKQLKARYLRFGDTRDWTGFRRLFVDDYAVEVEGVPRFHPDQPTGVSMRGADTIIAAYTKLLVGVKAAHQAVLPEITLTGPDTAHGIWALHEIVWMPTCRFEGWGHYHEDYVRTADGWKIAKTRVTRLKVQEDWL